MKNVIILVITMSRVGTVKEKECTKCKILKPVDDYHVIKNGKVYRSECKKCNNAMCKAYKAANRKKIADYNKIYKAENTDDISVYNHNYNKANRKAINVRQLKTRKIRMQTDSNFKMADKLRSRVRVFLKNKGWQYSKSVSDLIGCDWSAFQCWFASQFDDKMSMDNYGSYWHIDHVNPCCNFDVTNHDQMIECFHWSNMRPCIVLHNQKKTGKTIQKVIDDHKLVVKEYIKNYVEDITKDYTFL